MIRFVACLALSLTVLAGSFSPVSAAGERFFEALYDVPVMPGLEEVKDDAVLFDKPAGRIASVVAASADLSAAQVTAFYADVLPQLGWEKTAQNQYHREDSVLVLRLSQESPLTVVHFSLNPLTP